MVNSKSVVGIEPGNSGMVIGYQVDESIHLVSWVLHRNDHTDTQVHGQVSVLNQFPIEPGCEDYSFLDKCVKDIEHCLDSVLKDSVNTLELDAYLMMLMPCLFQSLHVSYAWLVSFLIILDCSLLLVSNLIKYGARVGHFFYLHHRQVKYQPQYFSSQPEELGFKTSPPDIITLNPANKKTDWSFLLLYWHWCSCHFRHTTDYFMNQNCSCWYSCL